jgi:hypothetical protein
MVTLNVISHPQRLLLYDSYKEVHMIDYYLWNVCIYKGYHDKSTGYPLKCGYGAF